MKIIFPFFWFIDFLLCFGISKYNTLINLVPLKSYKKTATHFFTRIWKNNGSWNKNQKYVASEKIDEILDKEETY